MNVTTNKVIVSRDVIVDEKAFFFSSNSNHRQDVIGWFEAKNSAKLQDTNLQEEEYTVVGDAHGGEGPGNAQETVIKENPKWLYSLLEDVRENELPQPSTDESNSRPKRSCTKNVNYALTSSMFNCFEPQNYDEAKDRDEWEIAMKAKYDALMKNKPWTLEELPLVRKPLAASGCTK